MLRGFLTTAVPRFNRVLLIESGSRELLEGLIPGIYKSHGENVVIDVLTCYGGDPKGLRPASSVFRLSDFPGGAGRKRLVSTLQTNAYNVCGMICSGEIIMSRWKWYLALQVPAKTFLLNENGDYFWLDRAHAGLAWHFLLFRMGLAGAAAVPTVLRLATFPLTFIYLLLFASWANLRRWIRQAV